ncbi:hypothetical protein EZV62_027175 [Acer yangbiense]|uniref:Uncharacterized protein n=1 Tax=Acer yangbiense TaxID=1000413 RepID=A0A5C7GSZ3_9ROSI|nr:hypothetical protein EZV62_027175 [Acer yangbiense]
MLEVCCRKWGYKGGQSTGQRQAHVIGIYEEDNMETIEKLKSLLGTLEKSNNDTCSLVKSGKVSNSIGLNVSDKCNVDSWVIDSIATDQMTYSPHIFFDLYTMP